MAPLAITPSDPPAKFLLLVPIIESSVGLEVFVPRGKCLHQETQQDFIDLEGTYNNMDEA